MLLSNINKPMNSSNHLFFSLYFMINQIDFILSNNAINEFIMHKFDFNDEEIVDFYISFLKSLSLRLNTNPIQLFYNEVLKSINDKNN